MSASDHPDGVRTCLDDLRDLKEAADQLGLAEGRLRAAIKRGRFAARKLGGSWVTTAQEIDRYRRDNLGPDGPPDQYEPELTSMDATGDDGQVFGG